MKNASFSLIYGFTLVGIPNAIEAGTCALCREALRSGGASNLINGYYWSIVLIVSIPLVVLAIAFRYARKSYFGGRV